MARSDLAKFSLPLQAGITADDLVGLPDYILREEFPELFEESAGGGGEEEDDDYSNLPEGINLANLPAGLTVCARFMNDGLCESLLLNSLGSCNLFETNTPKRIACSSWDNAV